MTLPAEMKEAGGMRTTSTLVHIRGARGSHGVGAMTSGRWESGVYSTSFLPLSGLFRPPPSTSSWNPGPQVAVASLAKTLFPPASRFTRPSKVSLLRHHSGLTPDVLTGRPVTQSLVKHLLVGTSLPKNPRLHRLAALCPPPPPA